MPTVRSLACTDRMVFPAMLAVETLGRLGQGLQTEPGPAMACEQQVPLKPGQRLPNEPCP